MYQFKERLYGMMRCEILENSLKGRKWEPDNMIGFVIRPIGMMEYHCG
jgi:hypothetical protein